MGACFSRRKGRRPQPSRSVEGCRDPPPEPEAPQEETVKEVLSETPRMKTPRPSKEEDLEIEKKRGNEIGRDDRSEGTSDVCSVSEGFSVSTSVTEVTWEERPLPTSLVKFQRKRSSSSGDILLKKEKMTGSVAAVGCRSGRTSSPSPARRREGGGGSGGRMCLVRDASTAPKSRGNALCRDPGERSGRRSVSPAAKPSIGGQCRGVSAVRANGRSSLLPVAGGGVVEGGRFCVGGGGSGSGRCRKTLAQDMVECGNSGAAMGGKESLENPLVSLECFIFL
ncbi:hypothetical protein KFK09_016053 [Dendrobium nobile]|uniref:Uncharacterized protein n=1 Tax=Dendrobium nobile TaxID=94219 RepID=A0A8T3BC63_DENNO|nr:hypothetical protein KFK09_016053 [Dendrobium nobile]